MNVEFSDKLNEEVSTKPIQYTKYSKKKLECEATVSNKCIRKLKENHMTHKANANVWRSVHSHSAKTKAKYRISYHTLHLILLSVVYALKYTTK